MEELPSLGLLGVEVAGDLAAQERRGDALDSKAGIVLGFAGVVAGLSGDRVAGGFGTAGLVVAALAALTSGAAFLPRSFPTLGVVQLRQTYLTADPAVTRLRLLDTRIAIYGLTEGPLRRKARLVGAATYALGLAVVLVVIGAILG